MNRLGNELGRLAALTAGAGLLAGCGALDFAKHERLKHPDYLPANVHVLPAGLPEKMRRVAVLPLVADTPGAQAAAGAETMQAVLVSELGRAGAFEILVVSADDLRHATGRGQWTAEEKLPPALLQRLRDRHGCDAVLFSRLTQHRAYPPLAVGWSFKLVECAKAGETPRILWAADEVFDAGNPAVVNAARRYYHSSSKVSGPLADWETMLQSPRRFAQYTLHALALTLPPREFTPQVSAPPADAPVQTEPKPPEPVTDGSD